MSGSRLVQLKSPSGKRKVAVVLEPHLVFLDGFDSVYEMALYAISEFKNLAQVVGECLSDEKLTYETVYNGESGWKLLPAFDHPMDINKCMVAGTGLTHRQSALNRQAMHSAEESQLSDSMKMYLMGEEGGSPDEGDIGVQPEWFYKGNGSVLKGHGEILEVPSYGDDGGEEPEVAALYVNDQAGQPWRIGFATMNEFSDHVMEKKNYLYLAPSKIRNCALGPELVITDNFDSIKGTVKVHRNGEVLWESELNTGNKNMSHNLQNLEYHHFKYENHRQPGQVHIHCLGADAFSFGADIALEEGDVMEVKWEGLGRALKNEIQIDRTKEHLLTIKSLSK